MLQWLKDKKLICFDLDGTLLDSVGIWNQVDAALILQLGGQHIDFVTIQSDRDRQLTKFKHHTDPYLEYCGFLNKKYTFHKEKNDVKTERYKISQYFLDHVVELKPDAELWLQALQQQGFVLALTTTTSQNNLRRYQENNAAIYKKLNFNDVFSLILTRENVQNIKPDPEIYLTALNHFQISAEQCVIFEDSLIGVEAAKHAGIDVIAIYDHWSHTDWPSIQAQADGVFYQYTDLLQSKN
ncbi:MULTISPECIES: HAD family phosphatase [unclassified Acinetobacter]|uniref:HAD family hydrolase n=1 Tax=unclassified Acinetobacter TaxID=196816 RepID=UPI00293410F9|nr:MULTISPECIES: HAD family phosphatase [unclassified Acinetobacter]WOE30871.1 HAD family phosphatase [Acinetobacter sp. SAAs470]WOE39066.1 HAD family phosphatase [Acinetobacter sp. SAAs474]